ncbi:MAG: hypothetical protein F6K41_12975 [Symploca sp. SIO3E6]|nr:hypothetical protein [Caldora sp. SIO3E6]
MNEQSLFASLLSLNNIGQLYADDETFLGLLSTDSWNDLSIINPRTYANPYTLDSIQNKNGLYGSTHGLFSPYNSHSLTPPWILVDGQPVIAVKSSTVHVPTQQQQSNLQAQEIQIQLGSVLEQAQILLCQR